MTFVLDLVNVGATVSFFTAAADLAADRVTTPGPFLAKVLADADPLANTLLVPAAEPFAAKPPSWSLSPSPQKHWLASWWRRLLSPSSPRHLLTHSW